MSIDLSLFWAAVAAVEPPAIPVNPAPEAPVGVAEGGKASLMNQREFLTSIFLMIFGSVVIFMQFFYYKMRGKDSESAGDSPVRLSIVSLIIVCTLIMITSGYNAAQIGPTTALFGTLAGYLIGKHDKGA